MRKAMLLTILCVVGAILLSSCGLMPEEDVLPASPVLDPYEAEAYRMTEVKRGDLIITKTVNCSYTPIREEYLSFSVGSLYVDKVFAKVGEQVKAGQLLAQLELGDLEEQISSLSYQLKVLEMKKKHLLENRELDLRKQDIILEELQKELNGADASRAEGIQKKIEDQKALRAETEESYAQSLQSVKDSIYLQGLRLEEAKEALKKRQIFATMDGIVSFVSTVADGQRSVKNQHFMTVSDLDTMVFEIKKDNAKYFPVGTETSILCKGEYLAAFSVSAAELGEAETDKVYLRLKQPNPALQDGDTGKIELVLEQSQNTLYVNKDAVRTANGEAFVYMLDKDGMRIMQKVKTGIEDQKFIEIVEGLKENDRVILD